MSYSQYYGRVDMGFYIGHMFRPILKSLYGIHVLLVNQNADRSSHDFFVESCATVRTPVEDLIDVDIVVPTSECSHTI